MSMLPPPRLPADAARLRAGFGKLLAAPFAMVAVAEKGYQSVQVTRRGMASAGAREGGGGLGACMPASTLLLLLLLLLRQIRRKLWIGPPRTTRA